MHVYVHRCIAIFSAKSTFVSSTLVDFEKLRIIFKYNALFPLYAKVPLCTNNTLAMAQSSKNALFSVKHLFLIFLFK